MIDTLSGDATPMSDEDVISRLIGENNVLRQQHKEDQELIQATIATSDERWDRIKLLEGHLVTGAGLVDKLTVYCKQLELTIRILKTL